jgi:exodeoxyribonuclease V beta subunit
MRVALLQRGIGSVELAQESVFASADAQDLEQVLLAVLEPSRPGLLKAALSTDLIGLGRRMTSRPWTRTTIRCRT